MADEEKKNEGIDIDALKKAFDDLEASTKAQDEKGINDALNALKKLVSDALGEVEEDDDAEEEDNSAFDAKLEKYDN